MTVDNSRIIDAIGIDKTSDEVVLTIVDHLDWDDPIQHLQILQAKLNRYLGFLESDEIAESYPAGIGKAVRIDLIFIHDPSENAAEFLTTAVRVVRENGHAFAWRSATLRRK